MRSSALPVTCWHKTTVGCTESDFLDKTGTSYAIICFSSHTSLFYNWNDISSLNCLPTLASWKLRFTSATFPQDVLQQQWTRPLLTCTLFLYIRTSNFGADAKPKVNVLIFAMFWVWNVLSHVLKLRSTQRQKTNMSVMTWHHKEMTSKESRSDKCDIGFSLEILHGIYLWSNDNFYKEYHIRHEVVFG